VRPALIRLAATSLLLIAAAPAWAQYKWKDSRGQVHLSDLPPPREVPDKDLLQRPAAAQRRACAAPAAASAASAPSVAATASANRAPQDSELQARRKKTEQEALARRQADEARLAEQRAENCQRARQQVATLQSGQRIQRVDEHGERVIIDDAHRAAEIDQARHVADSDCR